MKIRFPKDPKKIRTIQGCPDSRKWNATKRLKKTGEIVQGYWEVEPTIDNLKYLIKKANDMCFTTETVKMFSDKLQQIDTGLDFSKSDIDVNWNCEPYEHQKLGFDLCYNNPKLGLFWDQGVGKTLPSMKILEHRLNAGICKNVLVVSPKTVRNSWIRQLIEFSPFVKINNIIGVPDKRLKMLNNNNGLFLINYDLLYNMRNFLKQKKFDFVIFDESHYLKTYNSLRSKAGYFITKETPFVLLLTGTPIGKGAEDIFSQFKIIDENLFGTSFYNFKYKYFHNIGDHIWILSDENAEKIKAKMMQRSHRLTKGEVLNLPPKIYQRYEIEMTPSQKKIYTGMKNFLFANINGTEVHTATALSKMMKLNQIASGFYIDKENNRILDINDNKVNELEMIVKNNPDMKLTVWVAFKYDIVKLKKRFPDAVVISGDIKDTDRDIAIDRLQNDDTCRMIILQIAAGATGITLTASELVVYYSRNYNPLDRIQSEDRNHRIGTKNSVLYIDLMAIGTVEYKILNKLEKRREFAENMLSYNEQKMAKEIFNELVTETVNSDNNFNVESILNQDKKIKVIEGEKE